MHLPSSGVALSPAATRGAQVGSLALAGDRRTQPARALQPAAARPAATGPSSGLRALPAPRPRRRPSPQSAKRCPLPKPSPARSAPGRRRRSAWPGRTSPRPRRSPSRLRLPCGATPTLAEAGVRRTRFPRARAPRGTFVPDENESARGRGAHAPPRRSRPARLATFSKFTCTRGRAGGRAPRARTCGAGPPGAPRLSPGRAGAAAARARGTMGAAGRAAAAAGGAGTARAWLLRGPGAECGGGGGHRRAARPVHANGRRPRHELFSSGSERRSAARRAARPALPRPPPPRSCPATSQTLPGRHRGRGPHGSSVPA